MINLGEPLHRTMRNRITVQNAWDSVQNSLYADSISCLWSIVWNLIRVNSSMYRLSDFNEDFTGDPK